MEKIIILGRPPVFSEKFLVDNNYQPYDELPEIKLKIYKNNKFLLCVDFNNMNGSIHRIKNKKNFEKILAIMKEEFAKYMRN